MPVVNVTLLYQVADFPCLVLDNAKHLLSNLFPANRDDDSPPSSPCGYLPVHRRAHSIGALLTWLTLSCRPLVRVVHACIRPPDCVKRETDEIATLNGKPIV